MDTRLLLLADSRLPAGGHAHSGGLEPAVSAGAVADLDGMVDFLRGRLATTGLVTAALSAAACAHAGRTWVSSPFMGGDLTEACPAWGRLDREADARMPSPAQRRASRAQGRALLRVARTTWPHPALDMLATFVPHHPIVLGATTAAAGGTAEQAAAIVAYGAVTGPASAAVRLLGLDPLAVHRALAQLADQVDAVAADAARYADHAGDGDWAALPALSAPVLDLYAELHHQSDVRLFES
jgi:urease accessory protein